MLRIAPIGPDDRADWLSLWEGYLAFYEATLSTEQTALTFDRLVADDTIHGAIARADDGSARGIVHWLTHPATWSAGEYCYLEDLYVAPDARGTGAGRALIGHVTDWAKDAGCAKVYWLTQNTNATARALYDRVASDTGFVHYQIAL
ncbi:GNAT family N-acetyltransferase [Microbacterium keratanolyticum]|uniref:GNAT family N-acetyltransferase n=1 Tax=Microbacterium keratanolyticum TaxID=67574 RepID=UPI00363058D6